MKVLVIGGGGREHAMAWKLAQSKQVDKVYCTPGNAGIAEIAECIDVSPMDFDALLDFVKYEWIDLTVVGPEDPLAGGIVDLFEREGRKVMGPTAEGAQLESSKKFCKDFFKRHSIPTAEYETFTSYTLAAEYVMLKGTPIVIKADGLAAGKGVLLCNTHEEAVAALHQIMRDRAFGDAGDRVVVEEMLRGEEASFMAFTDGKTLVPMLSSQDHKRALDSDLGLNTGGMGAYSPAPVVTPAIEKKIMRHVMMPTLKGLRDEGIKYKGILYAGVMIKDGEPKVLEFNCRLGDPECQPIMQRLKTDFAEICMAIADEKLHEIKLQWHEETSVCVVIASGGYPESYPRGLPISGLKEAGEVEGVDVFHAGTAYDNGTVVTAGGRVLGVTALGDGIVQARDRAYEAVDKISFKGMHYRTDIAERAIERLEGQSE